MARFWRALPGVVCAGAAIARALRLAVDGVNLLDPPREQLLRPALADLDLVGVGGHDERVHVHVVARVRLLRHDRLDDDVARVLTHRTHPPSNCSSGRSWSRAQAGRTPASRSTARRTCSALRAGRSARGCRGCAATSTRSSVRNNTTRTRSSRSPFVRKPIASSSLTASFVFGASIAQSSTTTIFDSDARSESADRNASCTIFLGVRCE